MLIYGMEEYSDDDILYHEFYEVNEKKELAAQINAFENGSINILIFTDKMEKPCVEYVEEFMEMVKAGALDIIKDVKDYLVIRTTDFSEDVHGGYYYPDSIQYIIQCI